MLPYHDENQTERPAWITIGLIGLNLIAWFFVQGAGTERALASSVCNLGLIAGELTLSLPAGAGFEMGSDLVCLTDEGPQVAHVFTSMFLHGSWMHLLGNMWFLWLFGNNVEDSMTRGRFLAFYLLCGVAAALLQVATDPGSIVPMVGASGAISGVMGAYLVLYPRVRVFTLVPLGFVLTTVALPAWVMLLYWAGIQVLSGVMTIVGEATGGVAVWARVGGFAAGVLLVLLFRRPQRVRAHASHRWSPRRGGWR
jgi:membrane associated rhomboid family serine protease